MEKFFNEKKELLKTIKKIVRSEKPLEKIREENEILICPKCGKEEKRSELRENLYVCSACGYHRHLTGIARLKMICDYGSFREFGRWIKDYDPLNFPGYKEKTKKAREKTSMPEAVITGTARIEGHKIVIGVMDGRFLMASMGMAVGEKITRAAEYARKKSLPLIIFSASGGARMQEGIVSLMQMAKTSAAIRRLDKSGNLFISVMTDPTTGGVTASFASLGDIQIAEPGALIGFAGPRVIKQTIRQDLPEDFQRAEFLKEHGFVDQVVNRKELRQRLADILSLHEKKQYKKNIGKSARYNKQTNKDYISDNREAYIRVEKARDQTRPTSKDYIDNIFSDFQPMAGDRLYGDDEAIIGGIANFRGIPVTVIGQQKGRSLSENIKHRFGMPNPEGYRKAERLMRQAEKFHRPIITFVDTPGAYPGKEAEENGQGSAIASCLFTLSDLQVPIINVFVGEGGSGGALAIGYGDRVIMLENSIFSILSPEGFASILWKDSSRWKEACDSMKLTSFDLRNMGLCDEIVEEKKDKDEKITPHIFRDLEKSIAVHLSELINIKGSDLVEKRYRKLRRVGKDLI
ncbi:acetyl-CoA carboxylase carboxyltransferase subunit alpha [Eubacteriales bacterium KG127]